MNTIKATVQGRRLELDVPADWPDGTEVEIQPMAQDTQDTDILAPTEIARILTAMDQFEPLDMTDEELLAWETQRKARTDAEKADFMQHAETLRRTWE